MSGTHCLHMRAISQISGYSSNLLCNSDAIIRIPSTTVDAIYCQGMLAWFCESQAVSCALLMSLKPEQRSSSEVVFNGYDVFVLLPQAM